MKILITGVAGFIGFNLALFLIKKKYRVYGIDNFDTYYSVGIKKKRIKILKKNSNFLFNKIDIVNKKKVKSFFDKTKIDLVIHLAAQAGVRYSYKNPKKYVDVNIFGFINIIDEVKNHKIKKFIYGSSSSVYGENKNFPLKENQSLKPKNIYAVSKKINEETAELYQKIYNLNCIGLRFFTVYGEWGRPDMFIFKLFKSFMNKEIFYLNNYGNHLRDFTYIGDVVKAVHGLINKKFKYHEVINICSSRPINIYDIVKNFRKKNFFQLKLTKIHKADVLKTYGSNSKLKKILKNIKFKKFYYTFYKTFEWYKKNNIYKF